MLVGLFVLHFVYINQCLDIDLLYKQATYVDATVGSYAVFNCPLGKNVHLLKISSKISLWKIKTMIKLAYFDFPLDFPQDIEIPYILHWNKEVSSMTESIL